jgi:hypothetical protein
MLQIIDYHNFNPSLSFKTNFLAKDFFRQIDYQAQAIFRINN